MDDSEDLVLFLDADAHRFEGFSRAAVGADQRCVVMSGKGGTLGVGASALGACTLFKNSFFHLDSSCSFLDDLGFAHICAVSRCVARSTEMGYRFGGYPFRPTRRGVGRFVRARAVLFFIRPAGQTRQGLPKRNALLCKA